jgi:hypothetical protein
LLFGNIERAGDLSGELLINFINGKANMIRSISEVQALPASAIDSAIVKRWMARIGSRNRARHAIRDLLALDDRMFADIGLIRGELHIDGEMFLSTLMHIRIWLAWKRGRPYLQRWKPMDRRELGLKWVFNKERWIETCATCGGDCGRCEIHFRIDSNTNFFAAQFLEEPELQLDIPAAARRFGTSSR